jgi:hypothetical protein
VLGDHEYAEAGVDLYSMLFDDSGAQLRASLGMMLLDALL